VSLNYDTTGAGAGVVVGAGAGVVVGAGAGVGVGAGAGDGATVPVCYVIFSILIPRKPTKIM